MKPRLTSSKKWTLFPKSYVTQIEQVFLQAFAPQFKQGKLLLEGRIYSEEILLRVGFLEKGRLLQNNFEVSMNYSQEKQDALERIHNCIDAAASMMADFFQSEGEVDFPREWKSFEFNGKSVWLQYTTENSDLEAEADRLLGLKDESLVKTDEDSEDALIHASEKISNPDPQATLRPSIFSSRKKKKGSIH